MNILAPKITINEKTYKVTSQIGEGAFAFVYAVTESKLIGKGEKYAIKKMNCQSEELLAEAQNEIRVLRAVKSPFVISLVDHQIVTTKAQSREVYMLLPLCYGSLQSVIDAGGRNKVKTSPTPPSHQQSNSYSQTSFNACSIDEDDVILSILIGAAKGLKAVHDAGFRYLSNSIYM
jgi:serine/threonine protein kinase